MDRAAQRFARWMWRRFRAHYFLALAVLAWSSLTVVILAVSGVAAAVALKMNPGAIVIVVAVGSANLLFGVVLAVVTSRTSRAVDAWGRHEDVDPLVVWDAALDGPRSLVVRGALAQLPLQVTLVPWLMWGYSDLSGLGTLVAAEIVVLQLIAGCGLLVAIGFLTLIRPVLDEVIPLLPRDAAPTRRAWSLRGRLVVAVGQLVAMSALATAGLTRHVDGRQAWITWSVVVSVGFAIYSMVLFRIAFSEPTFSPVRDLMAAATRVQRGWYDEPVPVTSADEFGDLAVAFNQMQHGLLERESLHAAFGSYVDPALAQRLIESGSAMFEGEEVVVTVFFADVRDFTAYADGVSPETAVQQLNRLFDVVVPVVHEHGGHANHYLGDGLLAVFGAPQHLERHADAAVTAAREIQHRVRAEFGDELRLGIGINTGPVIAGTVGGGGRHEFTVIGDTVNVAARVEQLTKETGDAILMTEATRAALSTPRPRSTARGDVTVRGKVAKVTLHAPVVGRARRVGVGHRARRSG